MNCNAQIWQLTPVDNCPKPLFTQSTHLLWPAAPPWAAITWQHVTPDSCPLSVSLCFARPNWTYPRMPLCPTGHRSMQNKLHQSSWEIKTVSLFALPPLILFLGFLPPQGLVITLTYNLGGFFNGYWLEQRSADIPPFGGPLVLWLTEEKWSHTDFLTVLEKLSKGSVRLFLISHRAWYLHERAEAFRNACGHAVWGILWWEEP